MSLRAVHVIVIFLSIGLLLFFGVWAVSGYRATQAPVTLILGFVSLFAGILLLPYIIWFIMKINRRAF